MNPTTDVGMKVPEALLKAGRIAAEVRRVVESRSLVGLSVVELCEMVEGEVRRMGGEPAFPCCVGLNEVAAHYTPLPGEGGVIRDGDVVKVDLGVHVEGYIADTATTICYNPHYDSLVEAARVALSEAVRALRDGVGLGDVGGVVSRAAEVRGFKTIRNLSGHLMKPYTIHAGKSVPNTWVQTNEVAREGEVYAVEPFLTLRDGMGYVVESPHRAIYSIVSRRKTGDRMLDEFVERVWEERRTLPFTLRWYVDLFEPSMLQKMLEKLVSMKVLRVYPSLVEAGGRCVAQFENTVMVSKAGVVVLA